ncbi:MAG TPA: sulfate adenylyltransferase [Arcobacter sp.]|nr:sulfate adenylyltransferase [Arcobacter sp.]
MIDIDEETLQDIINIKTGLFFPLDGFMDSKDYRSVVDSMKLSTGEVWTIPITFDIDELIDDEEIILYFNHKEVAKIEVEDIYKTKDDDIEKIFGTTDTNHPGVQKELKRKKYRVGGKISLLDDTILQGALDPKKTKEYFRTKGWNTIAGFQTRNAPHKAHEYLHRLALEFCDALFINPLVGWKKKGDFTQEAVEVGYKKINEVYYNNLNIYFETLKTPMRYAGPKEAIFHAIIRKNLGCTHFIIGRDHAGVGDYYGVYEAQELAKKLQDDLDIKILLFKEPYYCRVCEQIVSKNCCSHKDIDKISGTKIRKMLMSNQIPPKEFMRREVAQEVLKLKNIFI